MVEAALFHGEPATRAGNPGFARGSKPVAEVYTAARAVEWPIRGVYRFLKMMSCIPFSPSNVCPFWRGIYFGITALADVQLRGSVWGILRFNSRFHVSKLWQ